MTGIKEHLGVDVETSCSDNIQESMRVTLLRSSSDGEYRD